MLFQDRPTARDAARRPPTRRTRRTRAALLTVAGLTLPLLAACGAPFVDSRREAGSREMVGPSTLDRPVICYARGETTPEQVRALAAEVCAETGRVPRFDGEDLLRCRLMQPWRARFTCVPPGSAGPASPRLGPPAGSAAGPDAPGAVYPGGVVPRPPRL
ncbi:hypothetical protein [Roseospira goensis]|uniref:Uncharacterized protein n=1 Tax=Roseospira goensis TaxID=391922 RepID=A0A7W6RWE0_9PROT|nr:hypothetical protein [Roseospira goensis]MBB4284450.1 hypothetical protein [Roseospira goensis]